MKLWRICNARYNTLDGIGGMYVAGRWHSVGRPVVYMADHAALASLEVLVHMDMDLEDLPEFVLLEIEVDETVSVLEADTDPRNTNETRQIGDEWLKEKSSALLKVRSVVTPPGFNYLLNPLHEDADKVRIIDETVFEFDERLFGIGV